MIVFNDEYFMRRALVQAEQAASEGEVPVGAVAVKDGMVIASACNQVEKLKDATAHAEMIVLTQASAYIGGWRLDNVDIYVTKEPCPMCAGAIVNARVRRIIFGLTDPRWGAAGSLINIPLLPNSPHATQITGGVLADESKIIMQNFFKKARFKGAEAQSFKF